MNITNQQVQQPLQAITLSNLLSFGPDSLTVPLTCLNVLIGPNGSGKSNLIEALAILRATPVDVRSVIARGGGAGELIWKGNPKGAATVGAVLTNHPGRQPLRHTFAFRVRSQASEIEDERIEFAEPQQGHTEPFFFYRYQGGNPLISVHDAESRALQRDSIANDQSILAQRREPDLYPELAYVSDVYSATRIYREWSFGRASVFRMPQPADMRSDRLEEDFSNLGLILNRLRRTPRTKLMLLAALRDLYAGLDDFDVSVEGGTVQVFLTEGEFTIPATRLSDGTLRYLCLLAILCDPAPPRVICIEEPELGLHPDLLPKVAELLIDASQRTQLVVTTHSDILVDALTEHPEAVLICEKLQGQTTIRRLDRAQLSTWLESYRLGDLWTRGELGGTRW